MPPHNQMTMLKDFTIMIKNQPIVAIKNGKIYKIYREYETPIDIINFKFDYVKWLNYRIANVLIQLDKFENNTSVDEILVIIETTRLQLSDGYWIKINSKQKYIKNEVIL